MNQLLEELKKNGLDYCTKDRLISVGSTRAVFGIGDYVVKQHLFPYAFEQSKRECEFYEALPEHLKKWFTNPYYACEEYAIFERIEPLCVTPWWEEDPLDYQEEVNSLCESNPMSLFCWKACEGMSLEVVERELGEIKALCAEWMISWKDLMNADNVGTTGVQIKFLDYGLSEDFFEAYYQSKSEGLIPYMEYSECWVCREPIFTPVFNEGDPEFWFGFCTCSEFPNEYPIDEVRIWYKKEKQLKS